MPREVKNKPAQSSRRGSQRAEREGSKSKRLSSPAAKAAGAAAKGGKAKRGQVIARKSAGRPQEPRGPDRWLLPMLETSSAPLVLRDQPVAAAPSAAPGLGMGIAAASPDVGGASAPVSAGAAVWHDAFAEYKRRKAATISAAAALPAAAPMPGFAAAPSVSGARNWLPLGPSVVMDGQTGGDRRQPVAGRIAGLAIGPGGNTIYVASANGGVFRSTDGGFSWASADNLDLDPTSPASASLICGAIAIDMADTNRIYLGTGEGATLHYFKNRVSGALPAYRGVGVLRSDDGGTSWVRETSSPSLDGKAFFALAVAAGDRENVVGATTDGLYRREPRPGGQFEWVRLESGVFSSVVVACGGGKSRFFCARWGQPEQGGSAAVSAVLLSDDEGTSWKEAGSGFPSADAGRIALGIQPSNPGRVYALVAKRSNSGLHGLYRLDGPTEKWKPVANVPNVLPLSGGSSQGNYDLALAVDPQKPDIVYLGGSFDGSGGSVWRCEIQASGGKYKVSRSASIGKDAHSDIHVLVHSPDNPKELWCGCDGGLFLNRDPRASGKFASQNAGLACLCCNFIAQHPTDPSIIMTGLQDNGTAHKMAGPIWNHVQDGDGGYCLFNWNKPEQVLVFRNGVVVRSDTGGTTHDQWTDSGAWGWATMTQPIVGLPYDPANPANAKLVAAAAGTIVMISNNFGTPGSWSKAITLPDGMVHGPIFALAFASATRLFVGTAKGRVFQAERAGSAWSLSRLDDALGGRLGLEGLITDIAVDPADTTLRSIYIAFGSMAGETAGVAVTAPRVWWFDGTKWEARGGAPGRDLLNVEHNALAINRQPPHHLYVAADIGVWHSSDGGQNWDPLQNGLPDAPVFDLQIHPTQPLLRAATYGRGVYEIAID